MRDMRRVAGALERQDQTEKGLTGLLSRQSSPETPPEEVAAEY